MRLSRSIVGQAEADAVARVILEDGYLGMGKTVREFEAAIASYLEVEPWQVVSANSGTAALHMAVDAANATSGPLCGRPEVIVPALTFVASFQAVSAAGCRPVPCDVLAETGTIDLDDARARISRNTIAIMPVDYASNPWRLDDVYAFAGAYGLRVVEDAAHAFGCRHHGRKIGSFGDLVCFSFDGIKNITSGEGGCLVAFDRESANIAGDMRLLGVEGDTAARFSGGRSWNPDVSRQGFRYHLSNIMAAIGIVQLGRLEAEFIPRRRAIYRLYSELLFSCPHLAFLETDPEDYIVPHILPVRILDGRKPAVLAAMEKAGIPSGMHYKPNHLLSFFGGGGTELPNAELLYRELATLPMHPGLSDEDVCLVCDCLKKELGG